MRYLGAAGPPETERMACQQRSFQGRWSVMLECGRTGVYSPRHCSMLRELAGRVEDFAVEPLVARLPVEAIHGPLPLRRARIHESRRQASYPSNHCSLRRIAPLAQI